MGKLQAWSDKLRKFTPEEVDNALLKIVRDTQTQAIDRNLFQLQEGVDSKDQSLGEYRSPSYAAFKRILNPRGVVDLRLNGGFYKGFFAETDKFPVHFDSTDYKTPLLTEKYGNAIFGLDKQNKSAYTGDIKGEIQKLFRGILQV